MFEVAESQSFRGLSARRVSDEQHGAYGGIRCHGFGIDGRSSYDSELPFHGSRIIVEGRPLDPVIRKDAR